MTDSHFQGDSLLGQAAAGNCPNSDGAGTVFGELASAGGGGEAGGEDIVYEHDPFALKGGAGEGKGVADVGGTVVAVESGLGVRVDDATKEGRVGRDAGGGGEAGGESFGLVKAAIVAFSFVERNGDDKVDWICLEIWEGAFDEEFGEVGFEPFVAAIFEAVDDFFDEAGELSGGAGVFKVEGEFGAIGAAKFRGDCAGIPKAAFLTEGRLDPFEGVGMFAAGEANEGFGRAGFVVAADFADVREHGAKGLVEEFHDWRGRGGSLANQRAAAARRKNENQPSMRRSEPQSQRFAPGTGSVAEGKSFTPQRMSAA